MKTFKETLGTALMNAPTISYNDDAGEWGLWCGNKEHAEAVIKAAQAMQKLLPLLEGLQGWQDMDSAPKDGTRILLYLSDGDTVGAHYEDYSHIAGGEDYCWHVCKKGTEATAVNNKLNPPLKWRPINTPDNCVIGKNKEVLKEIIK